MKKLLILILTCITLLTIGYTNVKVYAATYEQKVTGISTILDKVNPLEIKLIAENKYQYTTERVNLRKEASTNSDIVTKIDKREKVQMITSSNEWSKVKYKDFEGYVKSEYLRDTELPSLDFTDEEIDLIAKIMWLEARSQSDDGLAAVYLVIRNRVLSLEFSDTVYKVLSDKTEKYYEFSSWKLLDTATPDDRIYEILDEAMNGLWDDLLDEDYVYFSTSPRNNHGTIKIDDHYFCQY